MDNTQSMMNGPNMAADGSMGGMPNSPAQGGSIPPQPPIQGQMPPQEDQEDSQDNLMDYALSEANLAKKLKDKKVKDKDILILEDMAEKVYKGWQDDERSRQEWMENNQQYLKMALLVREARTFPWPNASNIKYPLLATAAMQFSARAYPALVPSDGKVVKAKVIPHDPDGSKAQKAENIAKHMSYQVMHKMPNWEEDMDKLLMTVAISGICFKKTYHNSLLKMHHSHIVYPENFCVNYWAKSLEKAYRKTEILHYNENEVLEKVRNNEEFLDIDYPTPEEDSEIKDKEKETSGTSAPPVDKSTPHVFLAQHTFYDLDGDGYEEPYIITVHKATKKVVRVIARWDQDGVHLDEKGKVVRIEPVEYFTAFPFIPNPDGSIYALGFGVLLGPLNESVNSVINQLVDSGTLNNLQSGFIGKGLRLKMGVSTFQPGEWKAVNATGDDLRGQIFPLPTKEPSNVLMALLQMLITSGNQLASIAEIFVGKMPGQNTPATTTQETVKQGMAVFTAIYKRIYRSLDSEFKKIYRLNRIVPGIIDEEAKVIGISSGTFDYDDENLIIPGGDPTGDSEATKMEKIDLVGQFVNLGTVDRMKFTDWALSAREVPNYQNLLAQPSPPPPDPKMELAKAKIEADQQKAQQDMQAKQQDTESKAQLAQLKMALEQMKLENEKTRQAMELQGQQAKIQMDMLQQVLQHKVEAVKSQHDIQKTKIESDMAIRHANQMNQIKQQQAKQKPKGNSKSK